MVVVDSIDRTLAVTFGRPSSIPDRSVTVLYDFVMATDSLRDQLHQDGHAKVNSGVDFPTSSDSGLHARSCFLQRYNVSENMLREPGGVLTL